MTPKSIHKFYKASTKYSKTDKRKHKDMKNLKSLTRL